MYYLNALFPNLLQDCLIDNGLAYHYEVSCSEITYFNTWSDEEVHNMNITQTCSSMQGGTEFLVLRE